MSSALTKEQFLAVLPKGMHKPVNDDLMNKINSTISDPEMLENYRENILGFASVLKEGKFQMSKYLDAVRYVSYKLAGDTNTVAYSKTFPNKMADFRARGVVEKDIASYITAYNKNKLVMLIYEQSLIPTHILNADLYQKAINVQAELMITASSEKVRTDAANSLLTHLKPPETKNIKLDIGVSEDSTILDLREETMKLVREQRMAIEAGVRNAEQVAHSKYIIDGEAEEVVE